MAEWVKWRVWCHFSICTSSYPTSSILNSYWSLNTVELKSVLCNSSFLSISLEDKTSEFSKHYDQGKSDSFHVGRSEWNKQVVHCHTVYLSSVLVGDLVSWFLCQQGSFPWMISFLESPLPFKRCKCQLMADRKWVLWEQHKVCSTRAVMSSWEEAAVNMKGLCAAVLLHSYFTTHPPEIVS